MAGLFGKSAFVATLFSVEMVMVQATEGTISLTGAGDLQIASPTGASCAMECKSVDVNSDIKVKGKLAVGDSEDIGKDFTDIKKKTDDISNDFTDMKKKLAPGREKPGEGYVLTGLTIDSEGPGFGKGYEARNVLTDNGDFGLTASPYSPATYWLGPNDHTSWFVVDCGGGKDVTHFILKNTRNGGWGDRSTTMYKIETSMDKVSWRQAVATTSLQLSITRVKVASGVQRVRYVRFTFVAYAGKGGGLSYFGCYAPPRTGYYLEASIDSDGGPFDPSDRAKYPSTNVLADDGDGDGAVWRGGGGSWFVLDLGAIKNVLHFAFRNTKNGGRGTQSYRVEVSVDKTTWVEAIPATLLVGHTLDLITLHIKCGCTSRVRFVRFTVLDHVGAGSGLGYFVCFGTAHPALKTDSIFTRAADPTTNYHVAVNFRRQPPGSSTGGGSCGCIRDYGFSTYGHGGGKTYATSSGGGDGPMLITTERPSSAKIGSTLKMDPVTQDDAFEVSFGVVPPLLRDVRGHGVVTIGLQNSIGAGPSGELLSVEIEPDPANVLKRLLLWLCLGGKRQGAPIKIDATALVRTVVLRYTPTTEDGGAGRIALVLFAGPRQSGEVIAQIEVALSSTLGPFTGRSVFIRGSGSVPKAPTDGSSGTKARSASGCSEQLLVADAGYGFSVQPGAALTKGQASLVADRERFTEYDSYGDLGYYVGYNKTNYWTTSVDYKCDAALLVDMKEPYQVREMAICGTFGYSGKTLKPKGNWALEASSESSGPWETAGTFGARAWMNGQCYPFRMKLPVVVSKPYRYYRVRSTSACTSSEVRVHNLGFWGCRGKCSIAKPKPSVSAQLLTKESINKFEYGMYNFAPGRGTGGLKNRETGRYADYGLAGQPWQLADEVDGGSYSANGIQWIPERYVFVDMKEPHVVTKMAVCGFASSHRPSSEWVLEGTNEHMQGSTYKGDYFTSHVGGTLDDLAVVDGGVWTRVATFGYTDWYMGISKCYPFEGDYAPHDLKHDPRPYRYYRIRSTSGGTNGRLLAHNWGLWGYKVTDGAGIMPTQCDGAEGLARSDPTAPVQLITQTAPFTYSAGGEYVRISGAAAYMANPPAGGSWTRNGIQITAFSTKNTKATLNVDMKEPHTVLAAAVCGYNSVAHRPAGKWALEGSNDESSWANVRTFDFNDWSAYECYPFNVVTHIAKGRAYRYFRIRSLSQLMNGVMLIMNLGLWGCKGTVCGGTYHTATTALEEVSVKSRAAQVSQDDIIAGLAKQLEQLQLLLAEQSVRLS